MYVHIGMQLGITMCMCTYIYIYIYVYTYLYVFVFITQLSPVCILYSYICVRFRLDNRTLGISFFHPGYESRDSSWNEGLRFPRSDQDLLLGALDHFSFFRIQSGNLA